MPTPKIGLIGGLEPLSTIDYYMGIVERFHKDFGMDDYPELIIDSLSLKKFYDYIESNDLNGIVTWFLNSIDTLKSAGASFCGICSNTPHLFQKDIFNVSSLEMVSIVDATIRHIEEKGYRKVLILGTQLTMGCGLYDKPMPNHGIEPIIPGEEDRTEIGNIIFPNLENGIIIPEDKKRFIGIIERYIADYGADAVLLGCTELPLIIKSEDISVPAINTTEIHIDAIYRKYVSLLKD